MGRHLGSKCSICQVLNNSTRWAGAWAKRNSAVNANRESFRIGVGAMPQPSGVTRLIKQANRSGESLENYRESQKLTSPSRAIKVFLPKEASTEETDHDSIHKRNLW